MNVLSEVQPSTKMVSFANILVTTDFSPGSEKALRYATAFARRHGSKIHIMHVIPGDRTPMAPAVWNDRQWRESRKEMDLAEAALHKELEGVSFESSIGGGPVPAVISAAIQEKNISLLVLATHGRGGLKKLVVGSVAEHLIRVASCPVITVGPQNEAAPGRAGNFQRILFATDFGPASSRARDYALSLATQFGAKLMLLHVLPPAAVPTATLGPNLYGESAYADWAAEERASILARLKAMMPVNPPLAYEPEYVVPADFLPEGILHAAVKYNPDLIVMGANPSTLPKLAAHIPWAVTHDVMSRSKCPVLTVKP